MKYLLIAAATFATSGTVTGMASAQSYMNDSRIADCTDPKHSFESRLPACDKALAALNVDPDVSNQVRAWALFYRSDANSSLLKFDDAIADADKAHELFPDERHILNAQCWSRAAANREIDKAKEACDASLKINPDDPAVMDSAGLVALRQGRWDDAAKHYGKAYSHNSSMTGSLYGIALAAYAQGKTEAGDTILSRVKTRKPEVIEEFKRYGFTVEGMKAKAPKAN